MTRLIFVVISALLAVAINGQGPEIAESDMAEYSETVAFVPEADSYMEMQAVTPYDYNSIMHLNEERMRCWSCRYRCSSYRCCDNGFPQCCFNLVTARCLCCRG